MSYRASICRDIINLDEARESKQGKLRDLQEKIELIKTNPTDNRVIFYTPQELNKLMAELIQDLDQKEEQIKNLIRLLL